MTVKELIEILKTLNQDKEIYIPDLTDEWDYTSKANEVIPWYDCDFGMSDIKIGDKGYKIV